MGSTSVTQSTASQHLVHIGSINFLKCTSSILTLSTFHFVNIDQMGIDKVEIDKVGIDEVGRYLAKVVIRRAKLATYKLRL